MGEQTGLSSTPATSQVQPDPKNMPETAFVIAFCVKFMEALNKIYFWPEELDEALSSNEESLLLEKLHRLFMRNLLNLKALPEKRHWMKKLSDIISDKIENQEDFYLDHNPLKRVNDNYYALGVRDKVMILQYLVSWQLVGSNKIRELIQEQHKGVSEEEIKPLEVEVLGEDTKESKYYYLGIGARIYRETLVHESENSSLPHIKWEAISTTIDDLKNFASDRDEIDPSRSEKEKLLYTKIVNQVIPYLEEVAKDKDREMEEKKRKASERQAQKEVERIRQLKIIEQMHNNVEILPTRTRVRKPQATPTTVTNISNIEVHDSQSIVNAAKDISNTLNSEISDNMNSLNKKDGEDVSNTPAKESNHDTLDTYNNDSMDTPSANNNKNDKIILSKPRKNNKDKTSKPKKSSKGGSDEAKKGSNVRKHSKLAKKPAPIDTTIIENIPTAYANHSVSSHENIRPNQDVLTGDSSVVENATYEHHDHEHHEHGPHNLNNIVISEKRAFVSDTTISSSSPSKAVICIGNQPIDNVNANSSLKIVNKGRGRPRKEKNAARAPYTKGGRGRGRQRRSVAADVSGQDLGINKKGVPGEITFSISNNEGVQPWDSASQAILNNTISTTTINDIIPNPSSDTGDKQLGVPPQNLNISGFNQSPNVTGIAIQTNVASSNIDDNGASSGEAIDNSQNINHSSNDNSITPAFNTPSIETIADEVRLKSSKMTLDNLLTYEPNSGALHSEFLSNGNQTFTPTTNVPQNKGTSEIDHSEHPLITKIVSLITPVETDTEITKVVENNSVDNDESNESEEHNVSSDTNFWRTSVASLLNNEKIRDNNDIGLTVPNGSTDHLSVTRPSVNSNIQPEKLSIDTNIIDKQAAKRHQTRSTRPNSQAKIVESTNTSNIDTVDQSISDNKKRRQPSDDLWYERPLTRNQAKAAAMNDTRLIDTVNGTKRKQDDRQQNDELPERPQKRKRRFLTETDIDDSIGIFVAVDSKGNIDVINNREFLSQSPEGDTEKHIYFQPGPVGFLKLDTSLKHSFFQEDELFGETDSELSSCGSVSSIDTD